MDELEREDRFDRYGPEDDRCDGCDESKVEIARLRAALEEIAAKPVSWGADCGVGDCVLIASDALAGGSE